MNLADHAAELPRYKDFHPSVFDRHIHVEEIENFAIVAFRSRDSNILEECNFTEILKSLGGESEQVQVHRFGHWGCGWFEQILVHPDLDEKAAEVVCALANYPVWDEEAYSEACWAAAYEQWEQMRMRDKIELCTNLGESAFAARGEPSSAVIDYLLERIQ